MTALSRLPCRLLVALVLTLLAAPAAFAHAQLLRTDPLDGAVLAAAPARVSLEFNEPISPLALTLVGPDGGQSTLEAETGEGSGLVIPLPAGLGEGSQVLNWRVVSLDGHPIAGALVFSIGAASREARPLPLSDGAVSFGLWATRVLFYGALFFGVGGAVFGLFAPLPEPARRLARGLAGLGLLAAPLSLGFQGLDALGQPLAAIGDPAIWAGGWRTSYGLTALAGGLAFLAGFAALATTRRSRIGTGLGLLAFGLAALAPALSGHASAAEPQALTRPSVALHMAALLFWIGALPPLGFSLRTAGGDVALRRFSRFIPLSILALLASGIGLAVVQLGPPGTAWLTPYGFILAGKLALVGLLFCLALWNRIGLTRPALAGAAPARRRLRLSIRAEIGLVLLVLGLVAGWRFTPPPRALAAIEAQAAEPLYLHAMNETVMAMASLTPGHAGPVAVVLDVADMAGEAVLPQAVTLTFSAPDLGIAAIRREARAGEDGAWHLDDLVLPLAGPWRLSLDIRLDRFTLTRLETAFDLP